MSETPIEAARRKPGDLLALTDRAQRGDKSALPALRELLAAPAAADLLGGDLARQAQLTLVAKYSGKNLLVKEALTRKLELMRAELAGEHPTALERLLADRVAACWLHLHHLEAVYAGKDSLSLALGAYYQKSISAAQKRYLAAIKALALVRRLAVPVLQVNIARKQVTVAGPVLPGEAGASAGAKKVKKKSGKWYGRIPGSTKPVPLSANKVVALPMLAELTTKTELAKIGICDPFEEQRKRPLSEHLDDFKGALVARGNTRQHVELTMSRVRQYSTERKPCS